MLRNVGLANLMRTLAFSQFALVFMNRLSLAGMLLCPLVAAAQTAMKIDGVSRTVPNPDDPLSGASCSEFKWVSEGTQTRYAIKVPVDLNGQTLWFQLDTGSPDTMLYGDKAVQEHWASADARFVRIQTLKVGGTTMAPAVLYVNRDMPSGEGTLGLDILLNHQIVIDYPGRRFCILDHSTFPTGLAKLVAWSAASLARGKLYLRVQVGDEEHDGFFFDSGSSQFPMMMEHSAWTKLTGKSGIGDADTKVTGTQWGKPKTWPGAKSIQPVKVAGMTLKDPYVFYEEDGFYSKNFKAEGMIGNAPFWDSILVLDLSPFMRVGTVHLPAPPPR